MNNQRIIMIATGAALVAGFFLPWVDAGRVAISGWDIVSSDSVSLTSRLLLAMCPLLGLGLLVTALAKSASASTVAIAAGGGVLGYTFYKLAWGFVKTTGLGLWMILAAATIALFVGVAARSKSSS